MKKILMISSHFAPDAHIGAKRVTQFARNLPKFGWEPIVLTSAVSDYGHLDDGLNEEIRGMKIVRVKQWGRSGAPGKGKSKKLNLIKRAIIYLEQYSSFCYGWLIPVFFKALALLKQYDIKVVYASSPIPDSLMVGYLLKKFKGVKLVCDYRDPWTLRPYLSLPKLRECADAVLEKSILNNSDLVITVGEIMKEELIGRYNLKNVKSFSAIYNGYDKDLIGQPILTKKQDAKFNLAFWGNFKWFITPEFFLRGLSLFLEKQKEAKEHIRVEFLGRIEGEELMNKVDRLLEELNLNQVVKLRGFLPYKEGMARLFKSDAFLMIMPKCEGFTRHRLTGKIFEYMYINKYISKPVLGFVPLDGECAKLIKQTGIGKLSDPEDAAAIAELLGEAYSDFKSGFADHKPELSEIEKFDRMLLTKKLAEHLDSI